MKNIRRDEPELLTSSVLETMKTLIIILVSLISWSALAHHNYRLNFDDSEEITLTGIVTKFDWKNPHIEIFMDVADADGNITSWVLPTAAPGVAGRNGITAKTVLPGDTLVATGWPARDGSNEMRARLMKLEDGTEFRLSPSRDRDRSGMGGGMGQGGMR